VEIWQIFQEKMGILLQNIPLIFIFRIFGEMSHQKNAALTHRNEPPKEVEK
jgi:hypothetical protein